jgi:hypothetical protein
MLYPGTREATLDVSRSVLNISDGSLPFSTILRDGSVGNISGGGFGNGLRVLDSALTISGGKSTTPFMLTSRGDSVVHVFGGEMEVGLIAQSGGTIHVYGYGLVRGDAFLTGTLADGTEIRALVGIGTDGKLVLHEVPEPGAPVLVLIAGLAFLLRSRSPPAAARE